MSRFSAAVLAITIFNGTAMAREYHVSPDGNDSNRGSSAKMLKTISAAALKA